LVSALRSGRRGPRFKSGQPDHEVPVQGVELLNGSCGTHPFGAILARRKSLHRSQASLSSPFALPTKEPLTEYASVRRCGKARSQRPWGSRIDRLRLVLSASSQPSVITDPLRESDRSKTGTPCSSDIKRLYAPGLRYASPIVSRPRYSLSASRLRVAR
jgi:hypothetical protein